MKLRSSLLDVTVHISEPERVLVLNSALDPCVRHLIERRQSSSITSGKVILAEDSVASADTLMHIAPERVQHVAFHDYTLHYVAGEFDVALMNLLYQPSNAWMMYGVNLAARALREGGVLYVAGEKERGILTIGKYMQTLLGNCETLEISKGQRVLSAVKSQAPEPQANVGPLMSFADNKLDAGTRLLLDALEVRSSDRALDLGCGAGFIGLYIARLAHEGQVTMVDVSLAAVAASQRAITEEGLTNARALPSDGARAVLSERFDLIVTNPPFHQGGIQTTEVAERFIREAVSVLQPKGRFYLVANRFLKYEPVLRACFQRVEEVVGDSKFKVLRATHPSRNA